MAESNIGNSPLNQIAAIYCRNTKGELLSVTGRSSRSFHESWVSPGRQLQSFVLNSLATVYTADVFPSPGFKHIRQEGVFFADSATSDLTVSTNIYEYKSPGESQIRGVVALQTGTGNDRIFFPWFVKLVLTTAKLDLCPTPGIYNRYTFSLARRVTGIFSECLRNIAHGDLWDVGGGKDSFEIGVLFYTSRNAAIRMVLPAFPCKSTCMDKVSGTVPDKGEELALRGIKDFIDETKKAYPPGVEFLIISDGHVFSDCIGADDAVVNTYGEKLVEMRDQLFGADASVEIPFKGLRELFQHTNLPTNGMTSAVGVPVYISTTRTTEADTCRRLLLSSAGVDSVALREKIEASDADALALYRGFSKFMCEDLASHPAMKDISKTKQKKMASRIAFEMLKRNQAYSNLIEVLFPLHVRLSIHTHPNSGPKFGVNLLGRSDCRTAVSLAGDIPESSDDFRHIPTPWHNCVVKIAGREGWFMVKAKIVRQSVEDGDCTAEFIEGKDGCGSYTLVTVRKVGDLVLG